MPDRPAVEALFEAIRVVLADAGVSELGDSGAGVAELRERAHVLRQPTFDAVDELRREGLPRVFVRNVIRIAAWEAGVNTRTASVIDQLMAWVSQRFPDPTQ